MRILKILLLTLFILQPWLLNGLIRFDILAILICIVIALKNRNITLPIKEIIFILFSFFMVLFFTIINFEFDPSLFKRYITLGLLIIGGYYITNSLHINRRDLVKALHFILIFCTIFYLLSTQFDLFRNIALSLKGQTYGIENRLEVYRLWFPTSAHTFHWGLFFVVTIVILLSEKSSTFYILLCIICASIASRSAMLMSLLLCVIYIVAKDRKYLIVILFLIPISYFSLNILADEYTAVKYALEPIENLISSGQVQSKSSDLLFEKHLYLPDFKTIIFGDGKYMNDDDSFYGLTDSGIVRPMLYGGILFQLFYFVFTFRYLSIFKTYGIYGIVAIILFYVANIKAEILSTTPYFSLLIILYFIHKNEIKNRVHNLNS